MPRVADYIVERIYAENIQHIFSVSGRGALFLTDAVARLKAINNIPVHHEQAAAFAAVAYAQYTGQLGVCLVSTGCAATNTLTGVLSAWQDALPCLFISGQNTLQETSRYTGIPLRTYGQQEADIVSLVQPITKYAAMLTDPKQIAYEIDKALYLAQEGRKGPVWLDIPLDIQSMPVDGEQLVRYSIPQLANNLNQAHDVQYITAAIAQAERPVLLIGSGVRSAGCIELLTQLIEKTNIPLTFSHSAVDTYGAGNALSIGAVGTMGCSRAANFAVQNADLLLVLGCRLSSMTTGTEFCKFARAAKVVVVDIDPVEHSKASIHIDHLIEADLKILMPQLVNMEIKRTDSVWVEQCLHWKQLFTKCEDYFKGSEQIDLYHLAETLTEILPERSVLITDSGFAEVILPTTIEFSGRQRCLHPVSQGAMGFALPAIVGAHFASGCPIVAVIGDGSIMMNLQELQTIAHNQIPVKILVINNNAYAIIRKRQKELFRSRTIGTDDSNGVSCPDFEKVAACFGLDYCCIESSVDLNNQLDQVLQIDGPVLCEVMGVEQQEYIENSIAKGADRRLVRRPIEDQKPFLDRELFLSEMMIEAIDQ